MSKHLAHCLENLHDDPQIKNIRQLGLIAAFDMVDNQDRRNLKVYQYALEHEMLIRPIGHTVYFMPPYVITPDEIANMVNVAKDAVRLV